MNPNDVYTVAALAKAKGCDLSTVYRAIKRGDLESTEWGIPGGVSQTVIFREIGDAWKPNAIGRPAKARE